MAINIGYNRVGHFNDVTTAKEKHNIIFLLFFPPIPFNYFSLLLPY